jgi:hypothetical protein
MGVRSTLEVVDRWLLRASKSLCSTWDEEAGNFWRDSWREESDTAEDERGDTSPLGLGKGATSNNRSFQALVAVAHHFHDNSTGESRAQRRIIVDCVQRMVHGYYSLPLKDIREHGENRINPYTDAQLLLSYSLALSPVTDVTCELGLPESTTELLLASLGSLAETVANQLTADGVRVHKSARPHHFLTLHTVRALDAARRILAGHGITPPSGVDIEERSDYPQLLARVRDEIVQQLGLHLLPAPGFDSSSLISTCALLSRFAGDADSPLVQRAVDALDSDQSDRGTWTTAGVISFGRRKLVYMPSIEMCLVLCDLALADLGQGDTDIFGRAENALASSLRLVQSSFTRDQQMSGWGNDRTSSGNEVESWTTAVVLRFLISYRRALGLWRQERILQSHGAVRPAQGFSSFWADLDELVPDVDRQLVLRTGQLGSEVLDAFSRITDPTPNNSIVEGVRRDVLEPTLKSVSLRPVEMASFLLYGPPGTRKTSFVEAMAQGLSWPLLTLSPPAFLKNGIEGFEAAADEIFDDLMHLARVVVLFDECEEFFRVRPTDANVENRTVGAFITSGMLPRLQRLRDAEWLIFVINTNVEAFELDESVTRRGRLDMVARVGQPSLESQLRYLRTWRSRPAGTPLSPESLGWFESHLRHVEADMGPIRKSLERDRRDAQHDNPDRGDDYRSQMSSIHKREAKELVKVVTFTMLDRLANRCVGESNLSPITGSSELRTNLDQEFERFGPDSWIHEPALEGGEPNAVSAHD